MLFLLDALDADGNLTPTGAYWCSLYETTLCNVCWRTLLHLLHGHTELLNGLVRMPMRSWTDVICTT